MAPGDEGSVLRITAYGAAGATPLLETGAMENMLTQDRKEAGGFVHTFKADGTSG